MQYQLYYWPSIQGRGEFVRLALEQAGADYVDVARRSGRGMGVAALQRFLDDAKLTSAPYAPPFLKAGNLIIGQTANSKWYLLLSCPNIGCHKPAAIRIRSRAPQIRFRCRE